MQRRTLTTATAVVATLVAVKAAKELKFFVVDCAADTTIYRRRKRMERLIRDIHNSGWSMDDETLWSPRLSESDGTPERRRTLTPEDDAFWAVNSG